MRRILFITAFPPNNQTAGQYYSKRLLLDLIKEGYQVDLIYFTYPEHSVDLQLKSIVLFSAIPSLINCIFLPSWYPFFTKRFSFYILKKIKNISINYDIIYFDFSQTFLYSLFIKHQCKILMCHDIIFQKYSRTNKIKAYWIKQNEKKLLNSNSYIFTFSHKDCQLVSSLYFLTSYNVNFYLRRTDFKYSNDFYIKSDTFCFYGAWSRKENLIGLSWFIETVLPYINPKYRFLIIGPGLSRESIIFKNKQLLYTGYVEEPLDLIAQCQALIAPLFSGAGVKVKVIDTLSIGTPIIGTDIAFEGILNNCGMFYIGQTPQDFISMINTWSQIDVLYKINKMQCFISSYSDNHLPNYLRKL